MSQQAQIRKAWPEEHAGWNKEGWQKVTKAVTPLAIPFMKTSGYAVLVLSVIAIVESESVELTGW